MNYVTRRVLNRLGILPLARRLRESTSPSRRAVAARQRHAIARITSRLGPDYGTRLNHLPKAGNVLVVGVNTVEEIIFQAPLLLAFRAADYRPVVLLGSRTGWLEVGYRCFGVGDFAYFEDHLADGRHPMTAPLLAGVRTIEDATGLRWRDAAIGRYAVSTLMRRMRRGDPQLGGKGREQLSAALSETLRDTDAAAAILDRVRPDFALLLDHGYTPHGQVFDLQLARGGNCFTWNAAHRDGSLMLKRYGTDNRDHHPSSLSAVSWQRLLAMPWSERHWVRLRHELESCYRSGEWYGEVGTQFNTIFFDRAALAARLGLDPQKKTVALFPHIFWDATFFWGTDLFRNYEDWFCAALRAACANPALNWIIKVHPGNVVKDRRDGVAGEHSELAAIRATVGVLPNHVKLIPADSDISTFALFDLIDYCLTVRGTVGIEAACFGIPVITAGTGRYDRLGFTIDPDSPAVYIDLLSRLHEVPPMDPSRIELARRYAYGVLIVRPTPLRSVRFRYTRNAAASLETDLLLDRYDGTATAADIRAIAAWVRSGAADYLDDREITDAMSPGMSASALSPPGTDSMPPSQPRICVAGAKD